MVTETEVKCEACGGKGFTELEAGQIMLACPECEATGKVSGSHVYVSVVGLLFELVGKRTNEPSDDDLWMMAKEASLEKMGFPQIVDMPCGKTLWFGSPSSILNLPIEDIPCPCGNPNHHIVRFIDGREENDNNSGIERNNQLVGGEDTCKPAQPGKPKAPKKARKRSR